MKKLISGIFLLSILLQPVMADEGMWLLMHIKGELYKKMQKEGIKLTPEEIYDVNNASLKDAIVSFGGFCTGEIISSQGLVLTNHHCGYGGIQSSSTTEKNYLRDGFWAKNHDEEIHIPGLYVRILNYMDDVTSEVLAGVDASTSQKDRDAKVAENVEAIVAAAKEKNPALKIQVKEMFDGNEYYLFAFDQYDDIRLVGTPPEAIGKFGGDTDNWMWPRHTGDFSMFRIYSAADGKPAQYSDANVPFAPKHHLPVSLKGVQENDFAMILGFPGSTDRFMTSNEIKFAVTKEQPARVKIRRMKLDKMDEGMDKSDAVRLKYASKHASVANYWKYFMGQSEQLIKNRVPETKKKEEEALTAWINADENRKAEYGDLMNNFEAAQNASFDQKLFEAYFTEAIYGSELNVIQFQTLPAIQQMLDGTIPADKHDQVKAKIKEIAKDFYKDYDYEVSKNIYAAMLALYTEGMPETYWGATITAIHKKYKGDFQRFANDYFSKSICATEERFMEFLDNPSAKAIDKEFGLKIWNDIVPMYRTGSGEEVELSLTKNKRLFAKALRAMNADKIYYPNANSSIRLTYGSVLPYSPADGVHYDYITTERGLLEKDARTEDKTHEFYMWPRLKELIKDKDYGDYALPNGHLPVCFLSNNDITGGNSGSPVINAEGHLIGTAFDGNWEAMSGDIHFETDLQRTINVDVRYTLFIIEKYGNAKHLIDEMTIIK